MKAKTTDEIIALCKQKDEKAFQELYERFYPVAYRLALHIVKSTADAADVAQETMISVYHHVGELRYTQYFSLWLKRIVVGHCNRIFRKERHVDYVNDDVLLLKHTSDERVDHNPNQKLHFNSDKEVLDFFIAMLPAYQAETIILYYFQQMSIKEIAQSLDVSTGTVKSRLFMAKRKLKEMILAYEENEEIVLDFRSDALLGMLGSSLAASWLAWDHGKHFKQPFLIKAINATALLIVAGTSVWYGMSHLQTSDNASQKDQKFIQQLDIEPINTPQDAYFRLILMADHADQIQYMSETEQLDAQALYAYLKEQGGRYYELLMAHGWE